MVLAELACDDVHIARLAEAIEKDPGLMGRIVGVANSAFFGCSDRIYTVSDAILKVLGLNMVKSLAYSIVLSGPLKTHQCRGFYLDEYWYGAVTTATLARALAHRLPDGDGELGQHAYLSGLLHNFGIVLLAYLFPKEYSQVLAQVSPWEEAPFVRREQAVLGLDHCEAGAMLAYKWHLPQGAIRVLQHYLDPDYRGEHWRLSALVGLCAHLVGLEARGEERPAPSPQRLEALGLEVETVLDAVDEVGRQREELRNMAKLLAFD